MPAVTVPDLTVLPRLPRPGLGDQLRGVRQVTVAPQGYEGEGFPVRRAFAGIDLRDVVGTTRTPTAAAAPSPTATRSG